jgi:hypothetical protein
VEITHYCHPLHNLPVQFFFFPRLPPHVIVASLSRPVAFLLRCSRAAAYSFGVGEQMALVGTTSSTRFHIALVRPATRAQGWPAA